MCHTSMTMWDVMRQDCHTSMTMWDVTRQDCHTSMTMWDVTREDVSHLYDNVGCDETTCVTPL